MKKILTVVFIMMFICMSMILIGGVFNLGTLGAIGFMSMFMVVLPFYVIASIIVAIVDIKRDKN